MNTLYLYLISAGFIILPVALYTIFKLVFREHINKSAKITKTLSIVVASLAITAMLLVIYFIKPAMMTKNSSNPGMFDTTVGCVNLVGTPYDNRRFLNFCAWLSNALLFPGAMIVALTTIIPFKSGKLVNKFIQLPIAFFEFVFLFNLVNALCGSLVFNYQSILISGVAGLTLANSIIQFFEWKNDTKDMNWKQCLNMIGLFIIALLAFMPVETLSVLNSTSGYFLGSKQNALRIYDLKEYHRIVIYLGLICAVAFYFLFRATDRNVRKVALLIISIGALRVFLSIFTFQDMFPIKDGVLTVDVKSLPIHLCHTAMFVLPITIALNSKKLFYFTYFINVFGAACAILMPNTGEFSNVFAPDVVAYWTNHIAACLLPLLCVALKIFDRPKFKQMLWSLGFFAIYFVIIMFMNAWLSNYTSGGTDYLFINSDFILSKMFNDTQSQAILNNTFTWNWGDLTFVIRPLYQGLFFLVYALVAFGMWFIYSLFFRIADSHQELHNMLVVARKENISMKLKKEKEPVVQSDSITLKFSDFTKRYGNSAVLSADKINLTVEGGQIFGFLGPNGAGKSTCIKCAIGIQPVTDGNITVCGFDVATQPVQTKKLIGYVPDHYALYEKLTGREYINYIADLYGVSKEDRDARIEKYVNLFELQQAFDNRMQTYSHGMKQKITIMAALVHNPKIWILDEPLTGLDPQSIFQVKECMKAHAAAGNIVFFSSHIIDVVEKLCTRIAIVKKGHIVYEADMKQVEKDHPEGLESFYLSTIHDNGDLD